MGLAASAGMGAGGDGVTLTGQTSGASRAEITSKAEQLATAYFGTECVMVTLRDESCETTDVQYGNGQVAISHSVFTAAFDADEHHDVEARSYGPGKCRKCGREDWPQRPLARASDHG